MNPRCAMSDELFRMACMRSLQRFLQKAASQEPAPEVSAPAIEQPEQKARSGHKKKTSKADEVPAEVVD